MGRTFALCLAVGVMLAAGRTYSDESVPAVEIDGSAEHIVQSPSHDGALRLMVWQPSGKPPKGGYPVMYAFDSDLYFGYLSNAVSAIQFKARWTGRNPAILVGIGYPEGAFTLAQRNYDLTPPSERFDMPPRPNGKPWSKMGGGDAFLDALINDIKPFIAARYPVDETRETLFGHSFGGMMVLHTLFTRPDAFERYVAASPSIWFNDKAVLKRAATFAKTARRSAPIPLKIVLGGNEQTLTDWERNGRAGLEAREAWFAATRMVDNAREFVAWAQKEMSDDLRIDFDVVAGEGHGSVVPTAAYRGVLFALGE